MLQTRNVTGVTLHGTGMVSAVQGMPKQERAGASAASAAAWRLPTFDYHAVDALTRRQPRQTEHACLMESDGDSIPLKHMLEGSSKVLNWVRPGSVRLAIFTESKNMTHPENQASSKTVCLQAHHSRHKPALGQNVHAIEMSSS